MSAPASTSNNATAAAPARSRPSEAKPADKPADKKPDAKPADKGKEIVQEKNPYPGGAPPPSLPKPHKGSKRGKVTFGMSAKDLKKMDMMSQSDGFVEVWFDSKFVARTKVIKSNKDPKWEPITMDLEKLCLGNDENPITFLVFDDDDPKKSGENDKMKQYIGQVIVPLKSIKQGASFTIENPIKPKDKNGTLVFHEVTVKEEKSSSSSGDRDKAASSSSKDKPSGSSSSAGTDSRRVSGLVNFKIAGHSLKKLDMFSQSDGFFEVINDKNKVVYTSEVIMDNPAPKWKSFGIDGDVLCSGDNTIPFVFRVFDDDSGDKKGAAGPKRELIGEARCTLAQLLAAKPGSAMRLMDPAKPNDTNRGTIVFESVSVTKTRDFHFDQGEDKDRRYTSTKKPYYGITALDIPFIPRDIELDYDTWDTLRAAAEYHVRVSVRQHKDATETVERLTAFIDKLSGMLERRLEREWELGQRIREERFKHDYGYSVYDKDGDSRDVAGPRRPPPQLPPGGNSSWIGSGIRESSLRNVREAKTLREGLSYQDSVRKRDQSPLSRAGWKRMDELDARDDPYGDADGYDRGSRGIGADPEWGREVYRSGPPPPLPLGAPIPLPIGAPIPIAGTIPLSTSMPISGPVIRTYIA